MDNRILRFAISKKAFNTKAMGDIPNLPTRKKLFIKTYGCQMNVYDSGRMADVLAPLGYAPTETPDDADMVILNTCHIREKAAEKVFSDLGRIRPLKATKTAAGAGMIIAVAGCVAQAEGAEIMVRAPFVDIVLGPQTYHRLPEMVARAVRAQHENAVYPAKKAGILDTEFPTEPKFDHLPAPKADGPSAFLSIQEGCDKFCTFCVVPYTRGAEYSRPVSDILREARGLVSSGAKEITLLGQNVNAFHGEAESGKWKLARLVRALAEIDGLTRIRYTTSHPRDMDDDLIKAHGDVPQLMPFLHLPVQSGSDKILESMNRGHTHDDYRRIVEKLRAARPDIALSSDFITGYPGETDKDFEDTMTLVHDIGFMQSFSFKYSPRPGTPAAILKMQVPEDVKTERLHHLQQVLDGQLRTFNKNCVGKTFDVLLTNPGRYPGQIVGRSPYLQAVHVMANPKHIGTIVPLTVVSLESYSLGAVWADSAASAVSA